MNVDGTGPVRMTNNDTIDIMPVWSPDGKKIAFRSDRDGNPEIYVMNVDDTNTVRLTNNNDIDESPSWSPDGKKVIFTSNRDKVLDVTGFITSEIYIMDATGANPVRLTNNAYDDFFPSFSKK